jgi:hypothetical protein
MGMDTNMYPAEPAFTGPAVTGGDTEPAPAVEALLEGARRVLRNWSALLLMLLGSLLSAGLLALIPALNLSALAHRPVLAQMAAGIPSWQFVDLLGLLPRSGVSNPVTNNLALVALGFLAMPLVGGVISAFLYGGVLLTYREDPAGYNTRFSVGRFLWGCWRWFGAYLVVGLVQALLFMVIIVPLGVLVFFLTRMGPIGLAAGVALALLVVFAWLAVFELTRVRLVRDSIRNPFRAFGRGLRELFHRPLALLVFYAAALIVLVLVQVIFRFGINQRVPLDWLILAAAVQQGFILLRLFCQAMRLAGLMSIVN